MIIFTKNFKSFKNRNVSIFDIVIISNFGVQGVQPKIEGSTVDLLLFF